MKIQRFSRIVILTGLLLLALVLVKFGYEFTLALQQGQNSGHAAVSVLQRLVIGPELSDRIFFLLFVIGAGQLTTGLLMRRLPAADPP